MSQTIQGSTPWQLSRKARHSEPQRRRRTSHLSIGHPDLLVWRSMLREVPRSARDDSG
ncbi:MAG: hypothetical protein QOI96_2092, partial [Verrucomicrobiota bacterium]